MEENTNVQTEGFMDGFNAAFDEPVEQEAEVTHTEEQTDNQIGQQEEPSAEENPSEEQEGGAEEELFELKHLGQTQKVNREKMTEWAQKGMDYDRVRQRADALQQQNADLSSFRQTHESTVHALESMAKDAGVDIPTLLSNMEVNLLVLQGMNRESAQNLVQRRSGERNAAFQKAQETVRQQKEANERIASDLKQFKELYPDADISAVIRIPEIGAYLDNGGTLVDGYAKYEIQRLKTENQRLQEQKQAAEQNRNNRQKTVGSARTSGANTKTDSFLAGFNSVW